ncbi:tRNA-dihydrouridine synthase [Vibrio sinaloensis]|nr:tRNA-dihydrouridine synthase [Vibrio sinaloensis]
MKPIKTHIYLLKSISKFFLVWTNQSRNARKLLKKCTRILKPSYQKGAYLGHITRHMIGLFQAMPGARQWRRYISENAHKPGAGIEVVETALAKNSTRIECVKKYHWYGEKNTNIRTLKALIRSAFLFFCVFKSCGYQFFCRNWHTI